MHGACDAEATQLAVTSQEAERMVSYWASDYTMLGMH